MPTALDAILMILSVTKTADAVLQMGTGIYDGLFQYSGPNLFPSAL